MRKQLGNQIFIKGSDDVRVRKIAIVIMCTMLVAGSLPLTVFAGDDTSEEDATESGEYSAKDESVYGNLDANGVLENMYVVNTFHVTEPGEIVDHGNYTNVRNLSNLTDIEQTDDNTVHFHAEEEEFYYQGGLENQPLPWDINITYLLDGEEVTPDELAGSSGALEIQVATSANEDVDPVFFENYLLQISLTLDPSNADGIQAPDGTEATSGKDKLITFTVMPEQEEEFIVSANVTDFEMDPIDISASPASMSIDDPDLSGVKGEMQSLSDAISDINQGVGDLNSGIFDLNEGASELSSGSSSYLNGINELDQSSEELVNGSGEIRDALQNVSDAMQGAPEAPDIGELEALPGGLRGLASGLRESRDGLNLLKENYDAAYSNLDEAINGIPDYEISEEQIGGLLQVLENNEIDPEIVNQLIETYQASRVAKETYFAVQEAFGAVTGTLDQVSAPIEEMASQLDSLADEVESGMENLDQLDALTELQNGLTTLSSEYQSFHNGLVEYTDGVSELAASYQDINSGIHGLSDGTFSLESGSSELKSGTEELHESTSDLPDQMQSEVDEMLEEYDGSDFEPQSFVSGQNEKVDIVQFVLQTESIEAEEPETTEEGEEEEKSFWDRLMDLFQ
ncbi:YhgE/Pip domain-containing protein [Virgibacillus salidurans]|uniref:YhgE/Pip domain-containing protein n=1 Tax=Virgibacillus salidurans TaxID=2831673 RepID=UPI001F3FC923|nr:YhgE/Pip domain-containing protein [Virgibacillus sp. NKC19-16]